MRRATLADIAEVNALTELDFTGFLSCPDNVCLMEGEGAAFFARHFPGLYEVHCHFTQRGKEVREISLRMLDHMKAEHGAERIYAPIPNESRHVKTYVRWLGFKSLGPCPAGELFLLEM